MRGCAEMDAIRTNQWICLRRRAWNRGRRGFGEMDPSLGSCSGSAGMSCVSNIEAVLNCPTGTVRDRLWMWAHPAGSYNTAPDKNTWPFTNYGFTKTSRMTPAEGALYLGTPNVVF